MIANNHNICGRFNEPQLRGINFELQTKNGFSWKQIGLAASLLFVLSACKTMGQPKLTGKIIKKDRDTTTKSVDKGIRDTALPSAINYKIDDAKTVNHTPADSVSTYYIEPLLKGYVGGLSIRYTFFRRVYNTLIRQPMRKLFN